MPKKNAEVIKKRKDPPPLATTIRRRGSISVANDKKCIVEERRTGGKDNTFPSGARINLGERERIRVIVLLLPRNYLCPGYVGVFLLSGPQHSARAKRNETEYPGGRERERVL